LKDQTPRSGGFLRSGAERGGPRPGTIPPAPGPKRCKAGSARGPAGPQAGHHRWPPKQAKASFDRFEMVRHWRGGKGCGVPKAALPKVWEKGWGGPGQGRSASASPLTGPIFLGFQGFAIRQGGSATTASGFRLGSRSIGPLLHEAGGKLGIVGSGGVTGPGADGRSLRGPGSRPGCADPGHSGISCSLGTMVG